MSNELKSEYYTSMEEAIEKYNLIPEAIPFAAGDLQGARAHARRNNMMWLQEAALAKVVSGDTTLEEVVRVTSPQTPGAASPAPPQPASAG